MSKLKNVKMHENEIKLLKAEMIDQDDIQLHMIHENQPTIYLNECLLEQTNLFLGFASNQHRVLKGTHLDNCFSIEEKDVGFLRVMLDCRKTNDLKFHVNLDGEYFKITNKSDNDCFLIVLVENKSFLQLSIYDGKLPQKVSHLFVTASQFKESLRSIAFSMLNHHFEGFIGKLNSGGNQ